MCIVEIHEMKQGENQSKGRPTTSDKTCCEKLQKYLFFGLTLTKMLAVELKDRFLPLPYCMDYRGMCDPKGYGFSAVLVMNRV